MKKFGLLVFVIRAVSAQTSPCDVNKDGVVNIADVQTEINEALGVTACTTPLSGNNTCSVVDVQIIITAALGGTCNATAAQSNIQLPVEVIGLDGATKSISFSTPAGANLSGTMQLSLQIHGLQYETQASVQVNSSAWLPINTSTVTILGLAKTYGGIGGGYHTLPMTMNLPAGAITAGTNTLTFKFNGTDGRVSGYRVLAVNVNDSSGNALIPSSAFTWEDPNTWKPPSSAAADIATGQTLWRTASLTVPTSSGAVPILAHCTDCHAQDGRDLKYFNYSNNSIQTRSMFHGLTAQQGDQIASYIRTLNVPNPGRPWNPPYQPGPGLDSQPVANWAAGAGLGAVLDSDAAMQPYLMPGGSTAGWAPNQYLNQREIPIAMQLPDWNSWLPGIHPMDAFGTAFTSNAANTMYPQIRSALKPGIASVYSSNLYLLSTWYTDFTSIFLPPYETGTWTAASRQTVYSAALWKLVKTWEINQEFGLEGMPQAAFGSKADLRAWYSSDLFNTSPNMLHITPGPGLGNGSVVTRQYVAHIWYQLQLILNDGNGHEFTHDPIDYGYVQGILKDLASAAGYPPSGMLLMEWMVKGLQEEAQIGVGPEKNGGFQPNSVSPIILCYSPWNGLWSGTPAATRTALTQAWIQQWFSVVSSFTTAQYDLGKDGNGRPYASPTEDPGNLATDNWISIFGGGVWASLPRLRYLGVDPNLTYQISAWAATVWPAGNWAADNAATCNSTATCKSDTGY